MGKSDLELKSESDRRSDVIFKIIDPKPPCFKVSLVPSRGRSNLELISELDRISGRIFENSDSKYLYLAASFEKFPFKI